MINNKLSINENSNVFIIAEMSGNHKKDIKRALKIVEEAYKAGADAIKLQTYTADTITLNCKSDLFLLDKDSIWQNKYLYDLYKDAATPWQWHKEIKDYAKELGLIFFSSPFDTTAVDFLEELDVPCYKVASFEINDLNLIKYIAKKMKPILISTGVATIEDIQKAINCCIDNGNKNIILLKCTSAYPTPLNEVNLNTIPDMIKRFKLPVGLSDHTLGYEVPIAAVALGAKVIEKHLTLSKDDGAIDSAFSMTPKEFKIMSNLIRNIEKSLGKISYKLTKSQQKNMTLRRSLFASKDIDLGETFTTNNVKSIRPSYGLPTEELENILGRKANQFIPFGTPLKIEMIS